MEKECNQEFLTAGRNGITAFLEQKLTSGRVSSQPTAWKSPSGMPGTRGCITLLCEYGAAPLYSGAWQPGTACFKPFPANAPKRTGRNQLPDTFHSENIFYERVEFRFFLSFLFIFPFWALISFNRRNARRNQSRDSPRWRSWDSIQWVLQRQ